MAILRVGQTKHQVRDHSLTDAIERQFDRWVAGHPDDFEIIWETEAERDAATTTAKLSLPWTWRSAYAYAQHVRSKAEGATGK